jgi:hypothetical protein
MSPGLAGSSSDDLASWPSPMFACCPGDFFSQGLAIMDIVATIAQP